MTSLSALSSPYLNATSTFFYPNTTTALLTITITSTSYTATSTAHATHWANYYPTITCALPNPYQATYPYAWMTATGDALKNELAAFSATYTTSTSPAMFTGCPAGMAVNVTSASGLYSNSSTLTATSSTSASASTFHNFQPGFTETAVPTNTVSTATENVNVYVYIFVSNGSTISTSTEIQTATATTIATQTLIPPPNTTTPSPTTLSNRNKRSLKLPLQPNPNANPALTTKTNNDPPPPSLFFILMVLLTPLSTLLLLHLLLKRRRNTSRSSYHATPMSTPLSTSMDVSAEGRVMRKRVSFVDGNGNASERIYDCGVGDVNGGVGSRDVGVDMQLDRRIGVEDV